MARRLGGIWGCFFALQPYRHSGSSEDLGYRFKISLLKDCLVALQRKYPVFGRSGAKGSEVAGRQGSEKNAMMPGC